MGALADTPDDPATSRLETALAEVRRDRAAARHALKASRGEVADLIAQRDLIQSITDLDPRPPKWLTPQKAPSAHHATVCTILSDSHFDEVVNPDEIGGVNAYDRDIATLRLRRYFDQGMPRLVVDSAQRAPANVQHDGAVCLTVARAHEALGAATLVLSSWAQARRSAS